MNELIKIEEQEGIKTVSARELHEFLESKQQFQNWIKNKIEKYEFVENVDYTLLNKVINQVSGSKHSIEYHISLDMAKQLCMVENNEKGKDARKYLPLSEMLGFPISQKQNEHL